MITIANLLSSDLQPLARGVCSTLQSTLDIEVWLDDRATLADFRDGRICIAQVCGLAYTLLHDAAPGRFVPVTAPVLDDPRSGDDPVYFAEIVVPSGSDAHGLDDLAGARFAYNEEISFSGFRALERELRTRELAWSFFGERLRTGSHGESLKRVAEGAAEAASIDSQVLALKRRNEPDLAAAVRVVESLGPYPSPPVVINAGVCGVSADKLYPLLAGLGPAVLAPAGVRYWQPVDDAYYDPIRMVAEGLPGLEIGGI